MSNNPMNNQDALDNLVQKLAQRDSGRVPEPGTDPYARLLDRVRPGWGDRAFRFFSRYAGWVAATILSLALVAGARYALGELRAARRTIEDQDGQVRALQERVEYLDYLLRQTQTLMTTGLITLPDPAGFSVVEPGRARLRLAGEINTGFIQEVRYRWGVEPAGAFTTLHRGEAGPPGKRIPVEAVSPELERDGTAVTATVEFVPYPDVRERYPEFFTPERTRFSRTFVLGKGGIRPDEREEAAPAASHQIVIRSPRQGAKVTSQESLDGQVMADGGWPVVFVQPLTGGHPWWAQAPVEEVTQGHFTADVRFGDKLTKPNTKFRIAVVLAKSKAEALKYQSGDTRLVLPAGLPRSEMVTVIRE